MLSCWLADQIFDYLEKVQRASPTLRVRVVCSHSVKTGKNSSRKVVTYSGTVPFKYAQVDDRTKLERNWKEAAGGIDGTVALGEATPFIIASRMVWKVGDASTAQALKEQKSKLNRKHCHRDRDIEVTVASELPELVTYQLYVPPGATASLNGQLCEGWLGLFLFLFCPMWASLRLWWITRNVANLVNHTTYKTLYVRSHQTV